MTCKSDWWHWRQWLKTQTEAAIRHRKKSSGILVPMIEEFMRSPVNIEDERDLDFLEKLHRRMKTAGEPAQGAEGRLLSLRSGILSAPGLPSPPFQGAWDLYQHQLRPDPNFYFLTGNFLHLKWMFVLYKMER